MEMNVGKLKEIIANLPDDMLVFVGCEGYCNYDFEEGQQGEKTLVKVHDGKLFIIDNCVIEIGNGETL